MAAFDYIALDAAGRRKSGVLTAPDEAGARQVLARRRLAAVKVQPASRKAECSARAKAAKPIPCGSRAR